uniref:ABC transmembrane type-1 domain-containing protein n=1 Tax=Chenopodium quinoa TaxID=63459 RepID=A0A803MIJ6_CHEQI
MERLWNLCCGQSDCLITDTELCTRVQFEFVTHPSSCVNHAFIICFDILLLAGLLVNMICKLSSKRVGIWTRYRSFSTLQIASAILNGCLGLLYIGLGTWILVIKLRNDHSASPIHRWVLYFFQGFTWVLVGLTTSLKGEYFPRAPLRILSIFAFLSAGMFCFLALFAAIVNNETTVKVALDILSFLGATLLLLCTYKECINEDGEDNGSTLYTPLKGEANGSCKFDSAVQVSPFAEAGLFSRLTFWWLNPLMKLGKLKTIKDEDIPKLRDVDRAEFCYLQFVNQLNKQKQDEPFSQSSMFWTIVACHWNDILLSGFCAALKILSLSTGPLLLNAFIEVADGKEAFKYKGYLLALALFFSKTLESLSQRQWYFQCRLIGLKVRSLLTAAIYKKQLQLSNAARMMHSAGEIMNHITVDSYRIGEFPFWAHQIWTTSLQLCIALFILVHSVGLATLQH